MIDLQINNKIVKIFTKNAKIYAIYFENIAEQI